MANRIGGNGLEQARWGNFNSSQKKFVLLHAPRTRGEEAAEAFMEVLVEVYPTLEPTLKDVLSIISTATKFRRLNKKKIEKRKLRAIQKQNLADFRQKQLQERMSYAN